MKYFFNLFLLISTSTLAQTSIYLYSDKAPGLKENIQVSERKIQEKPTDLLRIRDITKPELVFYKASNNISKTAVIICPGGGYHILAWEHEGLEIAKWFAERGVNAFVLKYRLPQPELFDNSEIRPLQDAQQAIRYLRKNASLYNIDADKVGIMGFSAGGHLAASASTHFDTQFGEITDANVSVRPNFSILIYPVISFDEKIAHKGSRENLIGKNPSQEKIDFYSNDLQVKKDTPPAFLVHAFDDGVLVENSLRYYKALKEKGIASEMHLYDRGGHGFGMKKDTKGTALFWPKRLEEWLSVNNLISK
jgi:acetyl esterase/lipase